MKNEPAGVSKFNNQNSNQNNVNELAFKEQDDHDELQKITQSLKQLRQKNQLTNKQKSQDVTNNNKIYQANQNNLQNIIKISQQKSESICQSNKILHKQNDQYNPSKEYMENQYLNNIILGDINLQENKAVAVGLKDRNKQISQEIIMNNKNKENNNKNKNQYPNEVILAKQDLKNQIQNRDRFKKQSTQKNIPKNDRVELNQERNQQKAIKHSSQYQSNQNILCCSSQLSPHKVNYNNKTPISLTKISSNNDFQSESQTQENIKIVNQNFSNQEYQQSQDLQQYLKSKYKQNKIYKKQEQQQNQNIQMLQNQQKHDDIEAKFSTDKCSKKDYAGRIIKLNECSNNEIFYGTNNEDMNSINNHIMLMNPIINYSQQNFNENSPSRLSSQRQKIIENSGQSFKKYDQNQIQQQNQYGLVINSVSQKVLKRFFNENERFQDKDQKMNSVEHKNKQNIKFSDKNLSCMKKKQSNSIHLLKKITEQQLQMAQNNFIHKSQNSENQNTNKNRTIQSQLFQKQQKIQSNESCQQEIDLYQTNINTSQKVFDLNIKRINNSQSSAGTSISQTDLADKNQLTEQICKNQRRRLTFRRTQEEIQNQNDLDKKLQSKYIFNKFIQKQTSDQIQTNPHKINRKDIQNCSKNSKALQHIIEQQQKKQNKNYLQYFMSDDIQLQDNNQKSQYINYNQEMSQPIKIQFQAEKVTNKAQVQLSRISELITLNNSNDNEEQNYNNIQKLQKQKLNKYSQRPIIQKAIENKYTTHAPNHENQQSRQSIIRIQAKQKYLNRFKSQENLIQDQNVNARVNNQPQRFRNYQKKSLSVNQRPSLQCVLGLQRKLQSLQSLNQMFNQCASEELLSHIQQQQQQILRDPSVLQDKQLQLYNRYSLQKINRSSEKQFRDYTQKQFYNKQQSESGQGIVQNIYKNQQQNISDIGHLKNYSQKYFQQCQSSQLLNRNKISFENQEQQNFDIERAHQYISNKELVQNQILIRNQIQSSSSQKYDQQIKSNQEIQQNLIQNYKKNTKSIQQRSVRILPKIRSTLHQRQSALDPIINSNLINEKCELKNNFFDAIPEQSQENQGTFQFRNQIFDKQLSNENQLNNNNNQFSNKQQKNDECQKNINNLNNPYNQQTFRQQRRNFQTGTDGHKLRNFAQGSISDKNYYSNDSQKSLKDEKNNIFKQLHLQKNQAFDNQKSSIQSSQMNKKREICSQDIKNNKKKQKYNKQQSNNKKVAQTQQNNNFQNQENEYDNNQIMKFDESVIYMPNDEDLQEVENKDEILKFDKYEKNLDVTQLSSIRGKNSISPKQQISNLVSIQVDELLEKILPEDNLYQSKKINYLSQNTGTQKNLNNIDDKFFLFSEKEQSSQMVFSENQIKTKNGLKIKNKKNNIILNKDSSTSTKKQQEQYLLNGIFQETEIYKNDVTDQSSGNVNQIYGGLIHELECILSEEKVHPININNSSIELQYNQKNLTRAKAIGKTQVLKINSKQQDNSSSSVQILKKLQQNLQSLQNKDKNKHNEYQLYGGDEKSQYSSQQLLSQNLNKIESKLASSNNEMIQNLQFYTQEIEFNQVQKYEDDEEMFNKCIDEVEIINLNTNNLKSIQKKNINLNHQNQKQVNINFQPPTLNMLFNIESQKQIKNIEQKKYKLNGTNNQSQNLNCNNYTEEQLYNSSLQRSQISNYFNEIENFLPPSNLTKFYNESSHTENDNSK